MTDCHYECTHFFHVKKEIPLGEFVLLSAGVSKVLKVLFSRGIKTFVYPEFQYDPVYSHESTSRFDPFVSSLSYLRRDHLTEAIIFSTQDTPILHPPPKPSFSDVSHFWFERSFGLYRCNTVTLDYEIAVKAALLFLKSTLGDRLIIDSITHVPDLPVWTEASDIVAEVGVLHPHLSIPQCAFDGNKDSIWTFLKDR